MSPKSGPHFSDQDMLQHIEVARILIDQAIHLIGIRARSWKPQKTARVTGVEANKRGTSAGAFVSRHGGNIDAHPSGRG